MKDLFRYIEWRSPRATDIEPEAIVIRGTSPFREDLRRAMGEPSPADALVGVASGFATSAQYALRAGALALDGSFDRAFRVATEWDAAVGVALSEALKEAFDGKPVTAVASSPEFAADRTRVHDSLIALKILAGAERGDLSALLRLARGIHVTERSAHVDPLTTTSQGVARLLDALIVVPKELFVVDGTPSGVGAAPPGADPLSAIAVVEARRAELEEAYRYFSSLERGSLAFSGEAGLPTIESPATTSLGILGWLWALLRALLRALFGLREHRTQSGLTQHEILLNEETAGQLPEPIRSALASSHIDPTKTPVADVVSALRVALDSVQKQLSELMPLQPTPVYQLGQYFFTLSAPASAAPGFLPTAPQVKLQPVGFGDLQVVKQQIVRYEPGEISYIENVMQGEHYDREVRRRELQEEISVTERERIKEEERDLQATDRFELHTQTEETSRDTTTTTSGNTITSQYGSFVDSRSSNFARDVVSRAVTRLTERVREQRTIRLQRELLEKTVHGFENRSDGRHISGIYQWVDKIYQAQIYNYGKRLLYEAVIPEPAAFVIAMRRRAGQPESIALTKPPEPTFGPAELNAWNYLYYAKLYDVVGAVAPPPDEYRSITKRLDESWDSEQFIYTTDSIPLPDGYRALSIAYSHHFLHSMVSGSYLRMNVGFNDVFSGTTLTLNSETEFLPIYIAGRGTARVVVNLMVYCQRTQAHLEKWEIVTYEALMKGYRKQLSEYEEKLANLQALTRTQMLLGAGRGENRDTERVELKRAFLTLLTNQQFDAFDAIDMSAWGYPETDIQAAADQAGFISFFERAFEWENMLYFFYPYFWGRKGEWDEIAVIDDPDPQFEAFLKAGAARVVVPVRPGFEGALAHYVETGQVWLGEDEPSMYSPLFVSILEEIKDRDKAQGEEIPVGKPWDVRLPTTLVLLREGAKLPAWEQGPTGTSKA